MHKRGRKGRECGASLVFREYFTHPDKPRKLAAGCFCCQTHFCTLCSAFRSARLLADLVPRLLEAHAAEPGLRFAMLTVTSKDRESLAAMYDEQIGAWNKWQQKRRNALKGQKWSNLAHLAGGAMSFETKRGRGSGLWHFHGHAIVLAPPGLDKFAFVPEWSQLLGYEANLDFRYLQTSQALDEGKPLDREQLGQELLEVCKYPLKTTELGWVDRWNAAWFLRGKRLFRTFGSLRGFEPSEEFTDDLSAFDALPYLEIVLNWRDGKYRQGGAGQGSAGPTLSHSLEASGAKVVL